MSKLSKTTESVVVFFIFLSILVLSFIKGPNFLPDSESYESNSILRIGMYPMMIGFFKFIFKEQAFKYLALFQTLFSLGSIYYLSAFLRTYFKLSFFVFIIIISIFIFPMLSHSAAWNILSESVAYPLFLLTTCFFFKACIYKKGSDLTMFSVSLFILCFTRQQFVFFYVVSFIYGFYVLIFEKNAYFSIHCLLKTLLSLCIFFIAERGYHLAYHGHFAGTPFVGTQFLMRPLFVASSSALKSIDEPLQKKFISEVTEELKRNEIIDPDQPAKELYAYEYLYNTMYHKISSKIWSKVWAKEILEKTLSKQLSPFQAQQIIDKNALDMGLQLIQKNFIPTAIYYIKDTIRGVGGYSCFFFMFLLSLSCIIAAFKSKKLNPLYTCTLTSIIMHLGNSSLVCLFEPPLTRYVYTTNALFFGMLIIFLSKLWPYLLKQNEKLCAQ